MSKIVEIVDVSKIFTDFWGRPKIKAVQSINLEIRKGEIFGLLGPNGSGKSTTIKMMMGLLKPTKGKIAILGEHPRSVQVKTQVGFLPEESYLYPFLTAEEALHFFGGLYGLSKGVRKERIDALIQLVGLEHARHRLLGEFSKGMARRVGLAQALIGDPQFLILDEPTSGLDPIGILEIKKLILDLKQKGKTILLSSHLLSEVQDVCDRVAILFNGQICSYGTLEELLTKTDKFTFEISSTNQQQLQQIRSWLEMQNLQFSVQPARENLEIFFMRTIEKVGQETGRPSQVPTKSVSESKELDELLAAGSNSIKPTPATEEDSELKSLLEGAVDAPPEDKPSVDQVMLDELTKKNTQTPS